MANYFDYFDDRDRFQGKVRTEEDFPEHLVELPKLKIL